MADQPGAPSVQHDDPAIREVESREETIARVAGPDAAVDPSTGRGLNRALWRTVALWAAAGFVLGALVGAVLSIAPGPFETSGVGQAVGYAVGLGLALALVVAVIGTLLLLEREDGRVEREVERDGAEGPAR